MLPAYGFDQIGIPVKASETGNIDQDRCHLRFYPLLPLVLPGMRDYETNKHHAKMNCTKQN